MKAKDLRDQIAVEIGNRREAEARIVRLERDLKEVTEDTGKQIREMYDCIKAARELVRMSMENDSRYASLAADVLGVALVEHSEWPISWVGPK